MDICMCFTLQFIHQQSANQGILQSKDTEWLTDILKKKKKKTPLYFSCFHKSPKKWPAYHCDKTMARQYACFHMFVIHIHKTTHFLFCFFFQSEFSQFKNHSLLYTTKNCQEGRFQWISVDFTYVYFLPP